MDNTDYREDEKWTVYIHIVPKSTSGYDHDKYYVGITSTSLQHRWHRDGGGYKSNKHFWKAIQKYNWDNIEHFIFAEHLTKDEACEIEKTLISVLQSNNTAYGYNKTSGGEGSLGHICSDEEKQRRSILYSGKNNPYYGKKHSEEVRKKMRKNHADMSGGNNPRAKMIYQFDLNWNYINKYPSSRDAGRALGTSDGMGSAAIHHLIFSGFIWVFEDNIIVDELGKIQVKNKFEPQNGTHCKEVYQFLLDGNFVGKYKSVIEASRNTNICKNNIASVARHKQRQTGGYIWRYKKDVIESEENPDSFIMLK